MLCVSDKIIKVVVGNEAGAVEVFTLSHEGKLIGPYTHNGCMMINRMYNQNSVEIGQAQGVNSGKEFYAKDGTAI